MHSSQTYAKDTISQLTLLDDFSKRLSSVTRIYNKAVNITFKPCLPARLAGVLEFSAHCIVNSQGNRNGSLGVLVLCYFVIMCGIG